MRIGQMFAALAAMAMSPLTRGATQHRAGTYGKRDRSAARDAVKEGWTGDKLGKLAYEERLTMRFKGRFGAPSLRDRHGAKV